jgi:hypothetical protein
MKVSWGGPSSGQNLVSNCFICIQNRSMYWWKKSVAQMISYTVALKLSHAVQPFRWGKDQHLVVPLLIADPFCVGLCSWFNLTATIQHMLHGHLYLISRSHNMGIKKGHIIDK